METAEKAGFDNISSFRQIHQIRKRDGSVVPFDQTKIMHAVLKAMSSNDTKEGGADDAQYIARKVTQLFMKAATLVGAEEVVPGVEQIQDAVERELMLEGYTKTAKHYILYRQKRAALREAEALVPQDVKDKVLQSKTHFRNSLSEFVYYRTYSRWIEKEGRRETWVETVNRYMDYMMEVLGDKLNVKEYNEICQAILNMEVMPSMRLMWSAGDACRRTNVAAFNCSYIAPTCFQDFGEILYILACGTGVGFSVESRNVQEFPVVKFQSGQREPTHIVEDSKEGWADALVKGIAIWYEGKDISFDFGLVRPEGARLKTMGGRSSGPKPLQDLLAFTRSKILSRQGRRLTNLDVHDIICKIGDCIVAGGVRRSALISLSDRDDVEMRDAKKGHFYLTQDQRVLANNSAVYEVKPTSEQFLEDWLALVQSKSGERGIFNRGGLTKQVPQRRLDLWQERGHVISIEDGYHTQKVVAQVGTNPCGEITLLSKQFCNLTEVVCREDDTLSTLLRKIRIATILGTYQSMLTNFPYLSKEWKENCDKERLLGVSLTGQWDCPAILRGVTNEHGSHVTPETILQELRDHSVAVNVEYAQRFGINRSTSVTCGKPSGTVSQLVDAASGGHTRFAKYYIRRVRINSTDPLFHMLKDQGVPYFPEVGQTMDSATTFVFEFPVKSPGKVFSKDVSAIAQLEHWKKVKAYFTEHNPSVTISVADHEWWDVGNWVWNNWDIVGGLSFLPREDHVYKLAPYEEIDEKRYQEMCKHFQGVDYSKILTYEKEDTTEGSKEYACVGGVCEIQ